MGQDARTRYTKMVILNSFIELLKVQPITKITVKRICEMAEINRATFYKYYANPFDLLDKTEQALLEGLKNSIQQIEERSVLDTLTLLLKNVSENKDIFLAIASENGDRQFGLRLFDMCYQDASLLIQKHFPQLTATQQKQLYYFYARGFAGVLFCWIEDGMKETPEETASYLERLIQHVANQL